MTGGLYAPMVDGVDEDDDDGERELKEDDQACWGYYGRRDGVRRFPPPIPMCHMPTIFKRTYEEDGRLVIREVKVQHHEFFRAHRENGRLTLTIVHMHQSSTNDDDDEEEEEEEDEEEDVLKVEDDGRCENDVDVNEGRNEIGSTDHLPALPISFSSPTLPFPPLFEAEEDDIDERRRCGDDKQSRRRRRRRRRLDQSKFRSLAMEYTSMLSSSMPELTKSNSGGGIGHGCLGNGRSSSLIHLRSPLIHLVQS